MLNMYLVTHRKVGYGHLKSIKPFFMCKIILFVKSHNAQWESPTVRPPYTIVPKPKTERPKKSH